MLVKTIEFEHSPEQAAVGSCSVAIRLYSNGELVWTDTFNTWINGIMGAGTYPVAEPNIEADSVGLQAHGTLYTNNYVFIDSKKFNVPVAGGSVWTEEVVHELEVFPLWVLVGGLIALGIVITRKKK